MSLAYSSASLMITSLAYVSVYLYVFLLTSSVGFVIFVVGLFVVLFDGYVVEFVAFLVHWSIPVVAAWTILSSALAGLS